MGALKRAIKLFPESARLGCRAGLLSGGERQILTLTRALARSPKLLIADELSLGLAPLVVARVLAALREAAKRGWASSSWNSMCGTLCERAIVPM